jgi:hypothetical protein
MGVPNHKASLGTEGAEDPSDCRDGLGGRQTARGRCPGGFQVAEARELHAECAGPPTANSYRTATFSVQDKGTEMSTAGGKRSGSRRSLQILRNNLAIINDERQRFRANW